MGKGSSKHTSRLSNQRRPTRPTHHQSRISQKLRHLSRSWWIRLLAFVLVTGPGLYAIIAPKLRPKLRIVASAKYAGHDAIQVTSTTGVQALDIDLLIHCKIVNTSAKPVEVEAYLVEAETLRGWQKLAKISVKNPRELLCREPLNPTPVSFDISKGSFEDVTHGAVIEPGHSLEGWMLLSWGSCQDHRAHIKRLRITLLDTDQDEVELVLNQVTLESSEPLPHATSNKPPRLHPNKRRTPSVNSNTTE